MWVIVCIAILVFAGVIMGQLFPDNSGAPQVFPPSDTTDRERMRQDYARRNAPRQEQYAPGRSRININDYEAQVKPEPEFDDGYPWKPGSSPQINPPQAVPENLRWFGLGRNATKREVKHEYYKRAQKLHPDHGGTDAAMQDLNERYDAAMREAR